MLIDVLARTMSSSELDDPGSIPDGTFRTYLLPAPQSNPERYWNYMLVYWVVTPSSALKMEEVCSPETFVFTYKSTRRYNPEIDIS
jgi:hypothetical protein